MSGAIGANADSTSGGAAPQTGGNDRLNAVKGKAGAVLKKLGGLARIGGNAAYRRGTQFLDQILMNRFGSASAKGRYTIQLVAHDMLKRWLAYAQMTQPGKNWRVERGVATPRAILQFLHDTYGADQRAVPGAIRMMQANGMLPPNFEFEASDGRRWGSGDPDAAASPSQNPPQNRFDADAADQMLVKVMDVNLTGQQRGIMAGRLKTAIDKAGDDAAAKAFRERIEHIRKGDFTRRDPNNRQLLDFILDQQEDEGERDKSPIPTNGFAGAVNNAVLRLLQASPTEQDAIVKQVHALLKKAQRDEPASIKQIKKHINSIYRNPKAREKAPEAVAALGKMIGATNESVTILTLALLEDAHRGAVREGWRRIIREAADADAAIDRPKLMQFFLQLSWAYVKASVVRVKLPGDDENTGAAAGGGSGGTSYSSGGGRSADQNGDDETRETKKNNRALETAMNQSNFNYQGRDNFDRLILQARRDSSYTDFKANASSFINQTDTQEILGKDDPLRAMFMTVKAMQ